MSTNWILDMETVFTIKNSDFSCVDEKFPKSVLKFIKSLTGNGNIHTDEYLLKCPRLKSTISLELGFKIIFIGLRDLFFHPHVNFLICVL